MKLNKTSKSGSAWVAGCFGLLGLIAVAMLCPMGPGKASAVDGTDDGTASASMRTAVHSQSVVSISLQTSVDVDIIPKETIAYDRNTAKLIVATNNASGYSIYMHTTGANRNLVSNDETNGFSIAPIADVEGGKTLDQFAANSWGYNLSQAAVTDATTYKSVPGTEADSFLINQNQTTYRDEYNLTFGAAINSALPAGTYSNNVVVSAVANPSVITSLDQLTYMQDMTPEICANTVSTDPKNPVETQLIDVRDGNKYFVAKLADGNCWMTQNLDLDLDGTTKLSYTTSDVAQNSTFTGTKTSTLVPGAVSSPSQTTTYSWDFGKWVLAAPTAGATCGDVTNIATCTKVGFVDVSGEEWQPTFQAQEGFWDTGSGSKQQIVAVDSDAKTYDPHYLIGNYYQYNTATAGTGGTIANTNAPSSICPKGWHLPTSGTNNNTAPDSFYNLLVKYGLQEKVGGATSYDDNDQGYNIAKAPLYFVRSGYTDISGGRLRNFGQTGNWWSSTALTYTSSTDARTSVLSLNAASIYLSSSSNRWNGFYLRCLAD